MLLRLIITYASVLRLCSLTCRSKQPEQHAPLTPEYRASWYFWHTVIDILDGVRYIVKQMFLFSMSHLGWNLYFLFFFLSSA